MDQVAIAKAYFLIIPLMFLAFAILRLRWSLRIPAGIILAVLVAFGVQAFIPGASDYMVSFSVMASLYAILSLGLNSQWGYNGHLDLGEIGIAACREGVCQYVLISVVAVSLKKQNQHKHVIRC